MKTIKFFFVFIIASGLMACSDAERDFLEDTPSTFESIKSLYGIESVGSTTEADTISSVTTEEMESVLKALQQNGSVTHECKSEKSENYFGKNDDRLAVKMTAGYQARTRAGAFLENFTLCVSLNFNVNKDAVYYIGTSYSSSTVLFCWKGYGASLSTSADEQTMFTAITHLYFRLSDQGNCVVKVPVDFKGNYNFNTNCGTYSFTLSNCRK